MIILKFEHVEGKIKGKVILFALSTCNWCKKTRELLEEIGVAYDYVYVDLIKKEERVGVLHELKKWNPSLSLPTIVINDERVIIGYDVVSIKMALE